MPGRSIKAETGDGLIRCGSCYRVLLNHQEPYLGEPAAIAAAPVRAVTAQRSALTQCSDCAAITLRINEAFNIAAQKYYASHPGATSFTVMYSCYESYGDHSAEYEDMTTGTTGRTGYRQWANANARDFDS